MLRVKPSPAYRGWHGASRGGCGGEPVRFIGLPGKTIGPTSVSPKGLPPSPQGEGFSQKPLPSTPNDRTLPQSRASPCQPPLGGGQGPGQNLWPLPPLIRPLCGHLPPGEGSPQKGWQPSTKSNRTPPPTALAGSHLPLHAGRQRPAGFCV